MTDKTKRKNQPVVRPNLFRKFLILTFLVALFFFCSNSRGRIIFYNYFILLISISIGCVSVFLIKDMFIYYGWRSWILSTIPLAMIFFFGCGMPLAVLSFPTTWCHFESLSVVECTIDDDAPNGYFVYCTFQQNHFAGLVFTGERFNLQCNPP